MAITKWFLNKDFAIPFGLAGILTRFIDSFWFMLAIAIFFMSILHLVEWLLKLKNKSFDFPCKDFLILSAIIFFFARFIDGFWLRLIIVILFLSVSFFVRWLLKRETASELEEI